jgi:hypothetical protein
MLLFKGKLSVSTAALAAEIPVKDIAEAVPSDLNTFLLEVLFFILRLIEIYAIQNFPEPFLLGF